MRAGTRKLGGKRCWQVRMNTWGTCDLPQPVRGEAVPQLLPELSNRYVAGLSWQRSRCLRCYYLCSSPAGGQQLARRASMCCRSLSNPRPPSCLVLASPAWGAPEAVQVSCPSATMLPGSTALPSSACRAQSGPHRCAQPAMLVSSARLSLYDRLLSAGSH